MFKLTSNSRQIKCIVFKKSEERSKLKVQHNRTRVLRMLTV